MTDEALSIPRLEAWIEQALAASGTPGAAVWLERGGEVLLARGFGFRDAEAAAPADVDTVFGSGSITKCVMALAVLLLEADGRLSTDDLITAHLPDLRLPGEAAAGVSIHHLLTHTAGLPPLPSRHYAWLSQDDLQPYERKALERLAPREPIASFTELVAFLGDYPFALHAAPGAVFSYSNEGYNLLGAIVERLSGQSLPAFVRERILIPTGMSRSSLDLSFTLGLANVTRLYVSREGAVEASANWFNPTCWAAAGGLRTSARDLARFFRMLAAGGVIDGARIVPAEVVTKMVRAYTPGLDGPDTSYGYGLSLSDLGGLRLVSHGGGHKGVSAFAGFVADEGVVFVVLTNLGGAPAYQIGMGCARIAVGLPPGVPPPRPAPVALPAETLAGLCGDYRSGEGARLKVSLGAGGRAVVTQDGQDRPADAIADDALVLQTPDGGWQTIRFFRLGGEAVSHAFVGGRLVPRRELRAQST